MKIARVVLSCLVIAGAFCPSINRVEAISNPFSAPGQEVVPDAVQLETVITGLADPVYVTSARDGSNRLFIVEQPGRIKVLQPGASSATVFLDITDRVLSGGERGLLGLAFHPQFENNRRFFVNYTRRNDGATVIAEYRASVSNPNLAEASETVLLVIAQPFANHNGGMIEFGPDGFLYIGMGDGGSGNDPGNRAQDIEELLGKMLRININQGSGGLPYSSPQDNPFFGSVAGRDEIYAVGLRNPWRFSFDRATGQLYAGDVGQGAIEEIDIITRGGNYGWRVLEGSRCTGLGPAPCTAPGFIAPITEYGRGGGRCSVTGGYVYRGVRSTLPVGAYVFGDFCTGEILLFNNGVQSVLFDTSLSISSFGEDEAGEIYVVSIGGIIQRFVNPTAPPPPPPSALRLDSAIIRRRSSGEVLQPVTIRNKGKKYEIILSGEGFSTDAGVLINGREMNVKQGDSSSRELVVRLRQDTISVPGSLVIEVVNPGGSRSNLLTIQVLGVPA